MRANGAEYRSTEPDLDAAFEAVETSKRYATVSFDYRLDRNRLGILSLISRWVTPAAQFVVNDVKFDSPRIVDLRRNSFRFGMGHETWLKGGIIPHRSAEHPDCPPVPSREWEAEFLVSSPE